MSNWESGTPQFVFPKPGKALTVVLVTLFLIWLMFAIAINWGDASAQLFLLFCGNIDAILGGEIWRLFTAPLMHSPESVFSMLFTLLGLYFLTPSLEAQWGGARLLRFLGGSALIAYGFQMLLALILPAAAASKLVPAYWFGAGPVITAVAIAWALSFRNQQVRLMLLVPISAKHLVWFVVILSVLYVVAQQRTPAGLLSPFGGMLAGWLLGGGTPSPLRRWVLRLKLQQMEREAAREKKSGSRRGRKAPFDVIEGGRSSSPTKKGRGPDGNFLN